MGYRAWNRSRGRACVFCGIRPENALGIGVFSYTLIRSRRGFGTGSFGQISICDRCMDERHRGAEMRTDGFRVEAKT